MKHKAVWHAVALLAAVSAFGVPYDPEVHGDPIAYDSAVPVVIDGKGVVIDGWGKVRCATVNENVTLTNFVFRNGFADWGGCVQGGVLLGCRLENGVADQGGGAYGSVLSNCTVTGCSAGESGAALGNCTAVGCTFAGNSHPVSASKVAVHGGLFFLSALTRCTVTNNVVELGGEAPAFGGLGADLTIESCTFTNNTVDAAAGVCYGLGFARTTRDGTYREYDDTLDFGDPQPGPGPGPTPPGPTPPVPEDPQPDPSTYTPDTNAVFAVGEGMVGRYYGEVYLDQLGAGLSRTYDKKTTVKFEGLPAGLKTLKTADGSSYAYQVTGVPTEPLDGVTCRAYVRLTDAAKNVTLLPLTNLKIVPAFVAAFPPATNKVEYWKFPVAKIWPGYAGNEKNWSFATWPNGIKLATKATKYGSVEVAAGRLYGKPTKVGTFSVKATEKIDGTSYKSTHLATFPVHYEDGKPPAPAVEKPVPQVTVDLGSLSETVESVKDIRVGVAYEWAVSNTPGATVTASGLPTGLSLKSQSVTKDGKKTTSYRVAGVPSKAGLYVTTFTVKLDGVSSKSTAAFSVAALPAWAVGTYNGYGAAAESTDRMSATMTVSAVGKVSGKFVGAGKTWSLSATGYAEERRLADGATNFVVQAEAKSGKLVRGLTLTVGADGVSGTLEGETALDDDVGLSLWRNGWKDAGAADLIKPYVGAYTVALVAPADAGYGHGYLTLAVDKSGNAKFGGKLPDGTSVTGSAPLVSENGGLFVVWYQAPSAYKGGFVFDILHLVDTDDGDIGVRGEQAVWKSLDPAASEVYGEGFDRTLTAAGARYDKTADLTPYKSLASPDPAIVVKAYKITQSTGILTGTVYDPEDKMGRKTISFTGIIVLDAKRQYGSYVVTRKRTYTDESTGKAKTFSYKESVPVVLE